MDDAIIYIFFLPCALLFVVAIAIAAGRAFGSTCGRELFARSKRMVDTLLAETRQNRPELAQQVADIEYEQDMQIAYYLEAKKRPALKAADEIKKISSEKRQLKAENKALSYQLDFYEQLFPWLLDFKEETIADAISATSLANENDYDAVRSWVSPSEYQRLGSVERNQLALDRWQNKNKGAWEIGICYERYVGYLLEEKGYHVTYFGATMGVEDMGRDLIATDRKHVLVIQCKRWAKEKTIHEKHICQLYGSVAVLATQNPKLQYKGVFITSTVLSDVARKFAEYSNISVVESLEMGDYPLIKCNFSKSGDKIYHLPFDQQYDKIDMRKNSQCRYVWTVREAEQLGFRRAFKWKPGATS